MNATKILNEEICDIKVASLPTRPSSPTSLGGRGYSAAEMKAAFDKLPLFIIQRYNALIDDIWAVGDESLAGAIPTDIRDGHTLSAMFSDVGNGNFASYLDVGGISLAARLAQIITRLDALDGGANE